MRRGVRDPAFLAVAGGASGGAVDVTGLVGYWKFDGDLTDSHGSLDLTESGAGNAVFSAGLLGQAVALDGPLNTLGVTGASVPITSEAVSFSCWAKPESSSNVIGQLGAQTSIPTFNGDWAVEFQTSLVPAMRAAGQIVSSGGGAISSGSWHHLVGTYDRTNIKIYVNGVLQGTLANTTALGTGQALYLLGGLGLELVRLDEVSLWSRALAQAEVTALYNDGVGLSLT